MYSTCIFCNSGLGANEAVEHFPVGRRLAFDAGKGRLWVVCHACGRWNLSPLEERWEAIEECERLYRDTPARVSTDNVGLARVADGTELVRIGAPRRPEIAAWRYGDQFGFRRKRALLVGGVVAATVAGVGGAVLAAAPALLLLSPVGIVFAAVAGAAATGPTLRSASRAERVLLDDRGEPILQERNRAFWCARIRTGADFPEGWCLDAETARYEPGHNEPFPKDVRRHLLHGVPARRAISVFLARANASGGSRAEVQRAVGMLERAGAADRYFTLAERDARKRGWGYQDVWNMPHEVRLALEMAAHEDGERRALEGELAELERAWRAAEEIAAIADRLAVPPGVERKLERLRGRVRPGASGRR